MKAGLAIAVVTAALMATGAQANIPPQPMADVGWAGPGHLCEAEFTLAVETGEFAREDVQLEPSYPASNTIKSPGGWFTISVLPSKPARPARASQVRADRYGVVYAYAEDSLAKSFLVLPRAANRPALKIAFWKNTGSAAAASAADQRARYASVLDRLTFARTSPPDCLNPRSGAARN